MTKKIKTFAEYIAEDKLRESIDEEKRKERNSEIAKVVLTILNIGTYAFMVVGNFVLFGFGMWMMINGVSDGYPLNAGFFMLLFVLMVNALTWSVAYFNAFEGDD